MFAQTVSRMTEDRPQRARYEEIKFSFRIRAEYALAGAAVFAISLRQTEEPDICDQFGPNDTADLDAGPKTQVKNSGWIWNKVFLGSR